MRYIEHLSVWINLSVCPPSINVNLASLCPRIAALGRCLSPWVCFPCVSVTLPCPCHPIPLPRPWTKEVARKVPKHNVLCLQLEVFRMSSMFQRALSEEGHSVLVRHKWAVCGSVWGSGSTRQGSRRDRGSVERGRGQSVLDLPKSRIQPPARETERKSNLKAEGKVTADSEQSCQVKGVSKRSLDPKNPSPCCLLANSR